MTTISNSLGMPPSPRAMMDRRIDAAVEAGSLSQVDGDALDTALNAIDSALSSSSTDSTSRLDPSRMKDRIDSLINEQLSSGALTEDQASALQGFFAQGGPPPAGGEDGMSVDGVQGAGAMGGPGPMGGPPPPPPPSDSDDSDTGTSATAAAKSSTADQLDTIIAFLENLRANLAQSLYGSTNASGSSSTNTNSSANSGLVVDSLA